MYMWNLYIHILTRIYDLCSFPRQTIQYHSDPSMPWPVMLKKLKLNGSMKTYKTFSN